MVEVDLYVIGYSVGGILAVGFLVWLVVQLEKTKRQLQGKKPKPKPVPKILKLQIPKSAKFIKPSKVEFPKDEPYKILKSYDPLVTGRSKFNYNTIKDRFLNRMKPETVILINIELTNGMHRQFLVSEKDGGFNYRDKKYIIDNEMKYYNIDARMYMLDYHEEFDLPIKRHFNVSNIKKSIEEMRGIEIESATNPKSLERYINSKVIESTMKGQQLDEFMRQMRLLIIITMSTSLIHLMIFLFKTGMLQSIKIPGVN